jgi:hypothetical protein
MQYKRHLASLAIGVGLAFGVIVSPAFAGTPTGEWKNFADCPYEKSEVKECIYSETTSGEVAIGSTAVPIENRIVLQGGATFNEETEVETFYNATDGDTLTKVPQNVPGGISGIVPEESLPGWLKLIFKAVTENGLTGATATAEQAGNIELSKANLSSEEGVALKLPIRLHLSNPFLGSECYIGSNSNPIIWNLTTGTTDPLSPNVPISGASGTVHLKEKASLLELTGNKLVDNNYSVPTAEGCGGIFSFIVDPLIDLKLGLESPKGSNTTILNNTIQYGSAKKTKESA